MLRTKLFYLMGSLTLLTLFISTWGIQAQEATDEVLPERLEMLVYPPTAENSAQLAAVLEASAPQRSTTSAPAWTTPPMTWEPANTSNLPSPGSRPSVVPRRPSQRDFNRATAKFGLTTRVSAACASARARTVRPPCWN